jgi:hypothetical protein
MGFKGTDHLVLDIGRFKFLRGQVFFGYWIAL